MERTFKKKLYFAAGIVNANTCAVVGLATSPSWASLACGIFGIVWLCFAVWIIQ